MKLHEIIKIPQQVMHGFDLKKWDDAKQFKSAKVEKYPLHANVEGDDYFFCMIDSDTQEKIAFMKAIKIDGFSSALIIKRTWVEPEYKNKGLMTALYNTLHNQGFSLISDNQVSPESLSIWRKLHNQFGKSVKMIDADTHEPREITDADLTNPKPDEKEHLFFEGYTGAFGVHHVDNFVMPEYSLFVNTDSP
jgi:hypothetical protein